MGCLRNSHPSSPQPRPWVGGNRDWIVRVECTAEGVVVYPGNKRFPFAQLGKPLDAQHPLFIEVKQLIDRRQSNVRPGETPYRLKIRFLVPPEGLRAYYLAYPPLEKLNVPMARENVPAERPEPVRPE